jgi:hypothetical protein
MTHKLPVTPVAKHAAYKKDTNNGKKIYGYVTNSCTDKNYWCSKDTNHIGISKALLDSKDLTSSWNGRKVTWEYTSTVPSGYADTSPFCIALQRCTQRQHCSTELAWWGQQCP